MVCDYRKANDEALAAGTPVKYMYRSLYCPEKGMFCKLPESATNITGQYCQVGASQCTRQLPLLPLQPVWVF